MRLLHPLLLLTAIPLAALLALLVWRAGARAALGRPPVAALRCASLVLLVLALAQPQVGHGTSGPVTLVLDRSADVDEGASRTEREWLRIADAQGCASGCRVVQFAGVARLTAAGDGLLPARAGGPLDGGAIDLQAALRLAIAHTPRGGRIAVLSVGRETLGEATSAAAEARAQGVRIDVVALPSTRPDAAVTRLDAPASLHAGDPLSLETTVRSTVSAPATLSLSVDGVAQGSQKVQLAPGDNPFLFSLRAPAAAGSHSYAVAVSMAGDRVPRNNALATTVRVAGEPQVLVVGTGASRIAPMLRADGIGVSTTTPGRLPSAAGGYGGEDAVVLDDVSAPELGDARAQALSEAVKNAGLGLLVLGGPHSFSLGAYYHSPLQQLLPVTSLIPGNLQRSNIGLELILDHSGSMINEAGGVPKIEMAKQAAQDALKFLAGHDDEVGIIDFDIEPHFLVPLVRVTPGKVAEEISRRIAGLEADGGTNIYKALAAGAHQIEASPAPDRHIVLMTDGVSEPGSYSALLPTLAKDHISVSTVALGNEADFSLLQAIAKSTGGNYYATSNAHELPRIFSRETRLSARPVRVHGRIAVSAGASSPVVSSLAGQSLPPLAANVVTTLKQGAQADLLSQDKGYPDDPALAQWQYGLGRVVTWTPGLSPEWAGAFSTRTQLWQDAVRFAGKGVGIPPLTPSMVADSSTEVQIDTVQNAGVSLDLLDLTGSLIATDGGHTIALRFSQTAPSHYVADVPALAEGSYRYTIADGATRTSGLLAVPYPAVYLPAPADGSTLGPLAEAGGGAVLSAARPAAIAPHWTALWRWLTLAALICFLAGVALALLGDAGAPPPLTALRARRAAPQRTADREAARS